jgi:integrase/recombinase XerC
MSPIYKYYPQVTSFLEYLQYEKRYSLNTVEAYQKDLEQFFLFLIDEFDKPLLKDISSTYVRNWLASLKASSISSKSINRKASALKSFFKYQMKMGLIEISPMTTVSSPKIGKRLPEFVQETDLHALFNHVEFEDNWKGKTERLVMLLFYETGMRVSELVNLNEDAIDFNKKQVKVVGKGNKERLIPLSPSMILQLNTYLLEKPINNEADNNLFTNEDGKMLDRGNVYVFVHKYLSFVTTIQKKSPHILRHSFATHLMNNGADINAIKELLGHSSLASTQVYTHNSIEKLKDVFKKAHPKA